MVCNKHKDNNKSNFLCGLDFRTPVASGKFHLPHELSEMCEEMVVRGTRKCKK